MTDAPREPGSSPSTDEERRVSRRHVFQGAAGGLAVGALAAGTTTWGLAHHPDAATSDKDAIDLTRSYPFYDQPHQPGVETPPQRHIVFMTFDMLPGTTASDLQVLLARWSAACAQMMAGAPVGEIEPRRADALGLDTGEAYGLDPAGLTVTIGLGPGIFDKRFGLASRRPARLAHLPALPSDNIQQGLDGGDLSVQACADDPQVAYHAVRNLARMVRTVAQTRWTVLGFGRASAGRGQQTPRNLLGFKDGTRNVTEHADFDQFVWSGEPGWMKGGSYQVVRKIRMNIETWDADRISDQQQVFGRTKDEGAPLSGAKEFDTPDFAAAKEGHPVISPASHIALAAHENNDGVKILRRSYNYTDGINEFGQLDAGLLFISYQNDPEHFIRLQKKLGSSDLLNEYISHIGSGIFAIPPAPASGHYIGQELFG